MYTFGVVVLVRVVYASNRPTALWRFRVSTSNSPSGRLAAYDTPIRYIYQTYAQQDIRVCGDDHFSRQSGSSEFQGAFASSRKYLSTRDDRFGQHLHTPLIDRTLICHAILYHFQITLTCGRYNRPSIPLTLFLLSRPLEQLEFIRLSNFPAEICSPTSHRSTTCPTDNAPTQLPKSISTTSLRL